MILCAILLNTLLTLTNFCVTSMPIPNPQGSEKKTDNINLPLNLLHHHDMGCYQL